MSFPSCCQPQQSAEPSYDNTLLEAGLMNPKKRAMASVYNVLPKKYTETFSLATRIKGIASFTFFALAVTAYALLISGHLMTFPQDFVHTFTHIDTINLAIGLGLTTILVIGAAAVIHRARNHKDPLVNGRIFPSSNFDEHIEEAVIEWTNSEKDEKSGEFIKKTPIYIDKSTSTDDGKAYMYYVKSAPEHYVVSTNVILATPFYMIGTIVYHAIRMFIVPFYVLLCLLIEQCRAKPLFHKYGQRWFKLEDALLEPAK